MIQQQPLTIAIVPHAPYSLARGGMEVQQDQTIAALERQGAKIIRFNNWQESLEADVVHVFGCEYAHTEMVERAVSKGFAVVITPMFMPQRPIWQFALARKLGSFLPPTAQSLRQRAVQGASAVVAINTVEKQELQKAFGTDPNVISVIPNGIEPRFYHSTPDLFEKSYGVRDFVLCVGSIEPRKNQIKLGKAVAELGLPMVFIGPAALRNDDATKLYIEQFTSFVDGNENTMWIDGLSHDGPMLESAYASARTHALVSTSEAQGLATMEAYAAGCTVVVSDFPHLHDLFDSDVLYANPNSIASIKSVVAEAFSKGSNQVSVENHPAWLLTWDNVAEQLIEIYEREKYVTAR